MSVITRSATAVASAVALLAALLVSSTGTAAGTSAAYSVQTLHFKVNIGPNSFGDASTCDIVGDVYTPANATPTHGLPAILTTNGFGGSKDDLAGTGQYYASRGYVVLAYSGLGFGGSGCKITLDDPSTDGAAASQLISYLGGAPGIAYTDANHTTPAPIQNDMILDPVDHQGVHVPYDPRVGMIGGSYGGEVQFAAASVDPRLDTIVPEITWNDLSYSLTPNNTTLDNGVGASTPGSAKLVWATAFSAEGAADGVLGLTADPSRIPTCPNFANWVCPALVTAGTTGYPAAGDITSLRHASVTSYMSKVQIPTLLVQGETDTLFNLNEATATYNALRQQGTPVKMMWQSWGHSSLTPAPGESDYENARFANWFAHYLGGNTSADTGPQFSYFRPWVSYTGNAAPAYASSPTFPVGTPQNWYLSGAGDLVNQPTAVQPGSQSFLTPVLGLPTSFDNPDVVASMFTGANALPSVPDTTRTWSTSPLAAPTDVVGSPTMQLRVNAPTAALTQLTGPAGMLVLFLRLVDIAPNGTATPINYQIAPVRIPDVNQPFTVRLPAIVHQFPAGDRIGLQVEGGDVNYRGNLVGAPVTIASGSGQVLSLPVTG